jgi:hypothetical protein
MIGAGRKSPIGALGLIELNPTEAKCLLYVLQRSHQRCFI